MIFDNKFNYGPWQILVIVGGIIGIAAFFLTWMDVNDYIFSVLTTSKPYNGIDLMNLDGADLQKYTAVVTLVLSVVMLAVALLSGLKPSLTRVGLATLLLAILIVVAAVLFVLWTGYYSNMNEFKTGTIISLNIGFYLCAVAGALGIIGSFVMAFRS